MIILTVNTGGPQSYTFDGKTIETSMIRTPQPKIDVTFSKVVGDSFKNANLHGTLDAVVYAYSIEHYKYWSDYLGYKVSNGFFGENLSMDSLKEEDFMLGSEYTAGSTVLRVTGPRYPCTKLNFTTQNHDVQKHFEGLAFPGVYFEVLQEGEIKPGDKLELKKEIQSDFSVKDLYLALRAKKHGGEYSHLIEKALGCSELIEKYRQRLLK